MTAARTFPNDVMAVKAARQFALESLADHSRELLELVELLVSELATNSVRHTDSAFEVKVSSDPSQIRISVTDSGSGRPTMQRFDPTAVSGRGLALVEMLSNSWGVRRSESAAGGKTVWFVLDVADHRFRSGSTTHASDMA
jgi:anti-sigma regulatory factor (Ser/Thr protein kinase)